MKKIFLLVANFIVCLMLVGCSLFAPKNIEFIVYRPPADGSEILLAEKIQMKNNDKSVAENALIHLMTVKPVDDRAYQDCVPDNAKLLSLTVKDGIAYVDFSKEVSKKTMGSYEATMFMGAVVNTLTEFKEIKAVQILIEGQKKVMYCGVLDIEEPLTRNESLLPKAVAQ